MKLTMGLLTEWSGVLLIDMVSVQKLYLEVSFRLHAVSFPQ